MLATTLAPRYDDFIRPSIPMCQQGGTTPVGSALRHSRRGHNGQVAGMRRLAILASGAGRKCVTIRGGGGPVQTTAGLGASTAGLSVSTWWIVGQTAMIYLESFVHNAALLCSCRSRVHVCQVVIALEPEARYVGFRLPSFLRLAM